MVLDQRATFPPLGSMFAPVRHLCQRFQNLRLARPASRRVLALGACCRRGNLTVIMMIDRTWTESTTPTELKHCNATIKRPPRVNPKYSPSTESSTPKLTNHRDSSNRSWLASSHLANANIYSGFTLDITPLGLCRVYYNFGRNICAAKPSDGNPLTEGRLR